MRTDDLGHPYDGPAVAARVVSLVPSLTEALATDRPQALVGATDWCTHPADLDVTRVRGTKNPDLKAIRALEPDLVIANKEENRELDVRRLRDAGVPVCQPGRLLAAELQDALEVGHEHEVVLRAVALGEGGLVSHAHHCRR